MRAIWTGAISFGLIHIPVRLYPASRPKELNFHLLSKDDLCPINYLRVCRATGREVPYQDIVKGYEYKKGDFVVMTEEDFKKANVRKTQTIEVTAFADQNEIDIKLLEKPYYLEPAKEAKKAYALLVKALQKSKKVGIARFVLRNREHLALLKPEGRMLLLEQMRFESELRDDKKMDIPAPEVSARELEMAVKFIDQLVEPFRPQKYQDTYTQDLKRVISDKAKGKTPQSRGEPPLPTEVPDLMLKLRQSLAQAQKKRPEVKSK